MKKGRRITERLKYISIYVIFLLFFLIPHSLQANKAIPTYFKVNITQSGTPSDSHLFFQSILPFLENSTVWQSAFYNGFNDKFDWTEGVNLRIRETLNGFNVKYRPNYYEIEMIFETEVHINSEVLEYHHLEIIKLDKGATSSLGELDLVEASEKIKISLLKSISKSISRDFKFVTPVLKFLYKDKKNIIEAKNETYSFHVLKTRKNELKFIGIKLNNPYPLIIEEVVDFDYLKILLDETKEGERSFWSRSMYSDRITVPLYKDNPNKIWFYQNHKIESELVRYHFFNRVENNQINELWKNLEVELKEFKNPIFEKHRLKLFPFQQVMNYLKIQSGEIIEFYYEDASGYLELFSEIPSTENEQRKIREIKIIPGEFGSPEFVIRPTDNNFISTNRGLLFVGDLKLEVTFPFDVDIVTHWLRKNETVKTVRFTVDMKVFMNLITNNEPFPQFFMDGVIENAETLIDPNGNLVQRSDEYHNKMKFLQRLKNACSRSLENSFTSKQVKALVGEKVFTISQ